jgi:uncharacterized membrane protein required for colicin V production
MILDLILAGLMIIAIAQGFNRGLIPTLFAVLGYLGGGLLGLFAAKEITSDWSGLVTVIVTYLVAIFAGAQLGSYLATKVGAGIRKQVLFGPFKFLDSILGGALALLQIVILAAIVIKIVDYLPWKIPHNIIADSEIYQYFSGLNLLAFQISDLLKSVSSHLDQLRS